MSLEKLSHSLAIFLDIQDDLSRIEKETYIEILLHKVKNKGLLDTTLFIEFSLSKVPFLLFLKEYKNISSEEAKALISYGYVTFEDMINVFNFGLNKYSSLC